MVRVKGKFQTMGDFLKELRQAAGLSQDDVAKKLGYRTSQFISNWERSISFPPVSALKALADLFQVGDEILFQKYLEAYILEVTEDLKMKFEKVR